jgi:hypothetical protein
MLFCHINILTFVIFLSEERVFEIWDLLTKLYSLPTFLLAPIIFSLCTYSSAILSNIFTHGNVRPTSVHLARLLSLYVLTKLGAFL